MVQNATFSTWTREQVDDRLLGIMVDIHDSCVRAAAEYDAPGNYVVGANIAGFERVASAMLAQGVV
jgi:glutamate dehydrogenase (NADP+)